MADYSFLTVWKFDAPLEKIFSAIHDADNYHRWWKGQSRVETLHRGNELGIGAVKKFKTRSALPYSLTYTGTVREVLPLKKITGTTIGELEGTGTWLFESENGTSTVKYYWVVKTNSFFMGLLEPVLKPVFSWNHDVIMKWGAEGLARYLGCRLLEIRNE